MRRKNFLAHSAEKGDALIFEADISNQGNVRIKPKILQDKIHDNNFLIDGYYGYPGGHLLMMAQIQNKEVTTLFASDKQETVKNKIEY